MKNNSFYSHNLVFYCKCFSLYSETRKLTLHFVENCKFKGDTNLMIAFVGSHREIFFVPFKGMEPF